VFYIGGAMDTGSNTLASVSFGRFQVSPHRREFLADGRPVQIGGRAFDVLLALIDAQGSVVSKNAAVDALAAAQLKNLITACHQDSSV
jgi:DNA-binding response OmpR family regulator